MTTPFERAEEAKQRTRGISATYTPVGGTPAADSVSIIVGAPDALVQGMGLSAVLPSVILEVRCSDVADAKKSDQFATDDVTYQVIEAPRRNAERTHWKCPAVEID